MKGELDSVVNICHTIHSPVDLFRRLILRSSCQRQVDPISRVLDKCDNEGRLQRSRGDTAQVYPSGRLGRKYSYSQTLIQDYR